jgi:hypothetical protein
MGRTSRRKQARAKQVRRTPDQVISQGPITIARFGRHVMLANTMTPDEHREFIVDHALTALSVSSATLAPSSDASPPADFAVTLPVLSEASTRTLRAAPRGAPPAWRRPRRAMRWAPLRACGHGAGGWVLPLAWVYGVETSARAPSGIWSLDRGSALKIAVDMPSGAPRVNGSGRLVSDPSTRPSLLPLAPSTERSWGTHLRHRS